MCSLIITIRAVLWYITSLVGTLLILVALFTNRWLHGTFSGSTLTGGAGVNSFKAILEPNVGLFIHCKVPEPPLLFEGECIPDRNFAESLFTDLDDDQYPHAWRGAVVCFVIGLGLTIVADFFALLTLCCRSCIFCSVFTVCGSVQTFAALLFTLGIIAFPAGWGSTVISKGYCQGLSRPFILGEACSVDFALWLAVAGTVCTWIASSLAIAAFRSTKTTRCEVREDSGDICICGP